jgi:hypothetical protein
MSKNRADILIEGSPFKLVPGEGAYEQGASRAMIDFQEIETSPGTNLASRGDLRTVYQTSWAGGARWEKPMMDSNSIDSYLIADGFDPLREPGSLYPQGPLNVINTEEIRPWSKWIQADYQTAYAVGQDGVTYKTIATNIADSLGLLAEHSNVLNADTPIAMTYDATGGNLYILSTLGIEYVEIGTGQGSVLTIPGTYGSTLFFHEGTLYVWDSDTLQSIADPKGTPVASEVFDDGAGIDWLDGTASPAAVNLSKWSCRLALPTTDGIFVAKNIITDGSVTPWVYRIDRDALGNVIGTPIATLNPGSVILDLAWHQGNLIMASTSDLGRLGANDATAVAPRVLFHTWNGKSGVGVIGAARGNEPDEMVFKFLMSDQEKLFIGGTTRVWAYDAVRGGVHPMFDVSQTEGHFHSGFTTGLGWTFGHGGDAGTGDLYRLPYTGSPNATPGYFLESNFFNFSLPGELKTIVEATLMTDGIKPFETWKLYLGTDNGNETLEATWDNTDANTATKAVEKLGVRFDYRIEYDASQSVATPSKLKGIVLRAISGRLTPYWKLLIDGSEIGNFQNKVQRPQDVFDFFKTLRDNNNVVTFVDQYEGNDRGETATYKVKVQSVSIKKEAPKDSTVEIVLVRTT